MKKHTFFHISDIWTFEKHKKNDSDLFEKISRSSMQLLQSSCSNTDSGDAPPWNRFIDKNFTKLISSIHSDFFCWKFPRILLTFPKNYKDSISSPINIHMKYYSIYYIFVYSIYYSRTSPQRTFSLTPCPHPSQLVLLLIVCHTILVALCLRIWYWIN